jgi:tartrate-resistant acid phosphatase type 5
VTIVGGIAWIVRGGAGRAVAWAALVFSVTAAPAEEPLTAVAGRVTFAVIGDYGLDLWKPKSHPDDGAKPHERRNPHAARVADLVAGWNPDFVVTTGDNNYPKGEAATIDANVGKYYAAFIGDYQGAHGPGAAFNRFFPALGNHDWDAPGAGCRAHVDYFALPGNERYYDVVRGPVHLFVLDSDPREPDGTRPGSKQHAWFVKVATASRAPFRVVVCHHPPHSSGEHGGAPDADWGFESHGIDLVLSGHDHDYERIERDGITYVVNGAGGANLRRQRRAGGPVAGSVVFHHATHGAQRIDVVPAVDTPDAWTLTSRFIDVEGREIDAFMIRSGSRPTAR